jgi:diketogulonate reductase-like aldo/keto reductase
MSLSRRALLRLGAGLGASMLASGRAGAQAARTLIRKPIPSSGEQIPVIGLGSSQTFNLAPGHPEYATAVNVLKLFKDLGGKVIDSAPTYQRSEIFIGEAVQALGIRNDLFISTKVNVGQSGKAAAKEQMEGSSRVYGRRTIDLMQVWNLGDSVRSLTDRFLQEHIEAVVEWKAAGRARYIGITTSRDPQYADVEAAMNKYTLDFVQLDYSIGDRIPEQRLLPLAKEKGIAVLVNRPFGASSLFRRVGSRPIPPWSSEFDCTAWSQFFLKYIVSHPAVTCAIPATGDPAHLRENMAAGVGRLPDAAMRTRMERFFDSI